MSTLIERDSEALGPRLTAGLQILILGGLALALTTAISPTAALRGGILIKTLFIGRMVVLIARRQPLPQALGAPLERRGPS